MKVSKGWQNCHFLGKWFLDFSAAWGKAVSVEQPHLVCQISLKLEPWHDSCQKVKWKSSLSEGPSSVQRQPYFFLPPLISLILHTRYGISFPPLASCLAPDDSIWLSGLSAVPGTHAGSQAVWQSITIGSQSASVALSGPSRPALLVVGVVKSSPTPFEMKTVSVFGQGFSDPL